MVVRRRPPLTQEERVRLRVEVEVEVEPVGGVLVLPEELAELVEPGWLC
jgi:hypothetical protein